MISPVWEGDSGKARPAFKGKIFEAAGIKFPSVFQQSNYDAIVQDRQTD